MICLIVMALIELFETTIQSIKIIAIRSYRIDKKQDKKFLQTY